MKDPATVASLDKPRFYNLDTDIGEQTDVAEKNPDVVAKLKVLAQKWLPSLATENTAPKSAKPATWKIP